MINRITLVLLYSLLFSQQLELPKSAPSDQIVHHFNYTLNYSEQHEQAEWVAYTLSSSDVYGSVGRTNDFRIDLNEFSGTYKSDFIKNYYSAKLKWGEYFNEDQNTISLTRKGMLFSDLIIPELLF